MDLFGMGFGEILLILIVALIIFGPGRIPEIARTLGKTVRAFRKASFDLTTAVTSELETEKKSHQPQTNKTGDEVPWPVNEVDKANQPEDKTTDRKDR